MIGADLVEIDRTRTAIERTPRFRERVFTPQEIAYCEAKADPFPSYAARFAAKEAFRKLHPSLVNGIRFHDVEVIATASGRPCLGLYGKAWEQVRELNIDIDISLSHSGRYALAVVAAIPNNRR